MDLTTYDRIVVSSSAGKDSQAVLDHVATLAEAQGVLDRLVVVHCDLGRVEWKNTAELAEQQAARYGVRFIKVSRPQGDLLDQVEKRGMWPSPQQRFCTSDHKRGQVAKVFTLLTSELAHLGRQVRILDVDGRRAEESPARQKLVAFQVNQRATNGKRHVDSWLAIHGWTVGQVWAAIRASRQADLVHFAYGLGMPRLSCVFCIYSPKPALMLAGQHNPELLQTYVEVERKINHSFRIDLKLVDVQAALAAGEQPGPIRTWGCQ